MKKWIGLFVIPLLLAISGCMSSPTTAAVNSDITTLQTQMGTVQGDITSLQSSVSSLQNTINALNGTVSSAVSSAIAPITTSLSSDQSSLATLQSQVSTLSSSSVTTGQLSSISSSLTSMQNAIASLQSSVNTLQTSVTTDEANIKSAQASISTDESNIKALQTPTTTTTTTASTSSSPNTQNGVTAIVANNPYYGKPVLVFTNSSGSTTVPAIPMSTTSPAVTNSQTQSFQVTLTNDLTTTITSEQLAVGLSIYNLSGTTLEALPSDATVTMASQGIGTAWTNEGYVESDVIGFENTAPSGIFASLGQITMNAGQSVTLTLNVTVTAGTTNNIYPFLMYVQVIPLPSS